MAKVKAESGKRTLKQVRLKKTAIRFLKDDSLFLKTFSKCLLCLDISETETFYLFFSVIFRKTRLTTLHKSTILIHIDKKLGPTGSE